METKIIDKLLSLGLRRICRILNDCLRADYADTRPEAMFALAASAYSKKLEALNLLSPDAFEKRISDEDTRSYMREFSQQHEGIIEKIIQKLSIEELQAALLFGNNDSVMSTLKTLPASAARLSLKLLDIQDGDSILNIASGRGIFLREAIFQYSNIKSFALDSNRSMCRILNIISACMGWNINVQEGDIFSSDLKSIKANKLFIDAPLEEKEMDWEKFHNEIEKDPSFTDLDLNSIPTRLTTMWFKIISSLRFQAKKARAVAIIRDNSDLIGPDTEILRKKLIDEGRIEAVISLPEKLDYNRSPLYLIVFSNNNSSVRLVDAHEIYTSADEEPPQKKASIGLHPLRTLKEKDIENILQELKNDSSHSRSLSKKDLASRNYKLLPDTEYWDNDDYCRSLADSAMPAIKEVCQIYRGDITANAKNLKNSFSEAPTEFQYLQLKDVQEGIIKTPLQYLKSIDEKQYSFCVEKDILVMGRNAPIRIGFLQVPDNAKVLLSGNIYALQTNEEIYDPVYLMLYLQSEDGMRQLSHILRGRTAMQTIALRDLEQVKIPLIPLEEQKAVVSNFWKLQKDLQQLLDKADQIRTSIRQLVTIV
jgi:type I restriction enzyme M protein